MSEHGGSAPKSGLRGMGWQRWQMESFDQPPAPEVAPEPEPDPGPDPEVVLRQLHAHAKKQGHKQGYAKGHELGHQEGFEQGRQEGVIAGREAGYAEGLAQAREQGLQEAQQLHTLLENCSVSIANIEEKVGQSLLALALDIAGQVVRTTLQERPETVLAAVREVLHLNPSAGRSMRLWVHPDDMELVRLHLADELKEGHWRILSDESLTQGGCRAETPYGDIDATLETRWQRVAASLGGNRVWEEPV